MQKGGERYITIPAGGYLRSGVNAKGSFKVEVKFALNNLIPGWLFGSRASHTYQNFGLLALTGEYETRFAYGIHAENRGRRFYDLDIHTIVMDKGKSFVDGVQYTNYAEESFVGIEMLIGAFNNNGRITADNSFNIYYMKIWDNGVLIKDYTPYFQNGEAGLLDQVGNIFIRNSGSGTITIH